MGSGRFIHAVVWLELESGSAAAAPGWAPRSICTLDLVLEPGECVGISKKITGQNGAVENSRRSRR